MKNMKIVVIGGTGLIGKKLVNILGQKGHEVVAASPTSGVNTITCEQTGVWTVKDDKITREQLFYVGER